jgi:predicted nucleic acid-binding protein
MISEIVIDTNVLAHAGNRTSPERKASLELLEKLRASNVVLCVDPGADIEEAKNKSQIFSEYIAHLSVGSVGMTTLVHLATNSRLSFTDKKVSPAHRRKIIDIVHDKSDHVFVKVAKNSRDKTLATHDKKNFPKLAIARLKNEVGVIVANAAQACALLS